jgi:hypothetical protein
VASIRTTEERKPQANAVVALFGFLGKWSFSTDKPGATVEELLLKAFFAGHVTGWLGAGKRPDAK